MHYTIRVDDHRGAGPEGMTWPSATKGSVEGATWARLLKPILATAVSRKEMARLWALTGGRPCMTVVHFSQYWVALDGTFVKAREVMSSNFRSR